MANQIEGVYENILRCAEKEFLTLGFQDASLRSIAQNAGTSTSSIYTRFGDKLGLFEVLVSPITRELKDWFQAVHESFSLLPPQEQRKTAFVYSDESMPRFMAYVYDHFDVFKLLLTSAEGTPYRDFVHDLVTIEVDYTLRFMEMSGNDALTAGHATLDLIHMLSSAYFNGILETVRHDMDREEAIAYARQMQRFFRAGWKDLLRI